MRYLLILTFCLTGAAFADDWQDLSASLDGWESHGGEWSLADGVISGKAAPDENAWLLYTPKSYRDFEVQLDWRTTTPTNGGLQFRSHWLPKEGATLETREETEHLMYGYQANVETRQRLASGRLVDENGRGPLAETPLETAKKLSQKDWNSMKVVAKGDTIEIYLNDTLAHTTTDDAYIEGFFALQVFGFEMKDTALVEYRNIKVKEIAADDAWRALFNGENLDGWKVWGSEEFSVEDNTIIGRSGPKKSEGYLATEEQFKNFRVRGNFKMLGDGNFGLFYHSTITLREKDDYPVIKGVQGEVEPNYPSASGWLYESYQRGWLVEPDKAAVAARALRPDEWNTIEIESVDSHIKTWINGVRAMDLEDDDPRLFEGSFALQLHAGGVDGIQWKDLYVKK